VSVVGYQVEVSALGRSPVQRSPTECGVSECDSEASIMRRPWPTGGFCAIEKELTSLSAPEVVIRIKFKSGCCL
jgi:hypothetical protein